MKTSKYFNLDSPGTDGNGDPIPQEAFEQIVLYLESLLREQLWELVYPVVKYRTSTEEDYETKDDRSYPTEMLISDFLQECTRAEYQKVLRAAGKL